MAGISTKCHINKKIQALLQVHNPFGISEKGEFKCYYTTLEAYVDVMMRIADIAPQGYIDVPLIMSMVQEVALIRSLDSLHRRPEILKIDIESGDETATNAWRSLLERMLEITGCTFSESTFFAARIQFLQLYMKKKTANGIQDYLNKFNHGKENENSESGEPSEGDEE